MEAFESKIREIVRQEIYNMIGLSPKEVARLKEYARDPNYRFYIIGKSTLEDTIRKAREALNEIRDLRARAEAEFARLRTWIGNVEAETRSRIAELDSLLSDARRRIEKLDAEVRAKIGDLLESAARDMQTFFNTWRNRLAQLTDTANSLRDQLSSLSSQLSSQTKRLQGDLSTLVEYFDNDNAPLTGSMPDDVVYSVMKAKENFDGINIMDPVGAIRRTLDGIKWMVNAVYSLKYVADTLSRTFHDLDELLKTVVDITNAINTYFTRMLSTLANIALPQGTVSKTVIEEKRTPKTAEPTFRYTRIMTKEGVVMPV